MKAVGPWSTPFGGSVSCWCSFLVLCFPATKKWAVLFHHAFPSWCFCLGTCHPSMEPQKVWAKINSSFWLWVSSVLPQQWKNAQWFADIRFIWADNIIRRFLNFFSAKVDSCRKAVTNLVGEVLGKWSPDTVLVKFSWSLGLKAMILLIVEGRS